MIITPSEIRILAVSCALLLLGLVTLFDRRTGTVTLASLLLLGGVCSAVWCVERVRGRLHMQQEQEARAIQRTRLREKRQSRTLTQRAARRARREALVTARETLAQKHAEAHRNRHQATVQQTLYKASREAAIDAETGRLNALSTSALPQEVAQIFAHRGFRVEAAGPESPFDLFLTDSHDTLTVVRCVPSERKAIATDIRALESWRQAAKADQSYLISLTGFTPEAITSSRSLPITLVEAHLLAHWQHS